MQRAATNISFVRPEGFTLVELALVLTVTGLLISGVLKGQQLITNAHIIATIGQVNEIEAATSAFQDMYNGLPGDLSDGATKIPNCSNCNACNVIARNHPWVCGGDVMTMRHGGDADDGIVGWKRRNLKDSQTIYGVDSPSVEPGNETLFFWAELSQAGLLKGISYDGSAITRSDMAFGVTHPAAPIGGGFIVDNADGATDQPLSMAPARPPSTYLRGTVLALVPSPTDDLATTTSTQVLTPSQAAQIDTKIDDGYPLQGSVQAYGYTSGTSTTGCLNASARPYTYNGAVSKPDCGLFFEIQN